MRRTILVLCVAMLALTSVPVQAAEGDIMPFEATETTLDNGLKVIIVPTGFPNLVSVQIPVQTGSRNEVEPGKSGFAHFFEHMMFRGTPSFSAAEYEAIQTQAGARRNAYTTDDYTNYHTTFAKEDLEKILEIEADRFQNLDYSIEDFKTEARAVLGEYNKNSANPIRKLLEIQRDNAFQRHTYKHTTMGFIEDIEDMPNQFDYSKTFFDRWYRPENVALIIAGDVDPDETLALVRKYFGSWEPGSADTLEIPAEPAATKPLYVHEPWSDGLPYVTVAFHGPAILPDPTDYAAINMIMDLSFGDTSELYKRLVEQEQTVDQFFTYAPPRVDPYLITVFARVKDPANAVSVRDEIMKTFAAARVEAVDGQKLDDAKSNSRFAFARSLDNTGDIAGSLAAWVHFDRSYDTINEVYRTYGELTADDLQSAAQTYFTDANLVVTTLAKDDLGAEMAVLPLMADLEPTTEPAGVEVITEKTALPIVNMKLLFDVGSSADPEGKEGLSSLAASMVADAGSKQAPIAEITKAFYPIAASFDGQVDKEMTTFTGVFHRDTWEQVFDLALPQLLDPGFREDDFERLRSTQLNTLRQDLRANNEEWLSKEALQRAAFRGTRYEHPPIGTISGLESITLDDVRSFVAEAYARGNLTIGLSGDVPDGLEDRLLGELGLLPAEASIDGPDGIVGVSPEGYQVEIIEKDTRATAITMGHPLTVTREDPDFAALWLARAWLGEHRSAVSHLFQRIREVRGMNYGDYAYVEAFPNGMFQFFPDPNIARQAQVFEIWIRPVVPENGHMAARIALHELQLLLENGLSEEDFEEIRNYLMKNVYVMTSTQDQQIGYRLDSNWFGIAEFTTYMRDELSQLTVEDVNAAIREHWSWEDLHMIFVTKDAEGLEQALVNDTFSPITYDADKPQELLDEDQVIGARKLGIDAEDVTITPVEAVFE